MLGRQKTAFTFETIQYSVFLVKVAQYVLVMSNPVILYVGGKFCYTTLQWLFNCTAVEHGCILFRQDRQVLVTSCGPPQVTFGPVSSQVCVCVSVYMKDSVVGVVHHITYMLHCLICLHLV